jgi:hypothetical protein
MTPWQITFWLAGLAAGLVTVGIAGVWPALLPVLLVLGVGPLFSVAVFAAITFTRSWSHLASGRWRIVAGVCVCTGAYLLAFSTFLIVAGYSGIRTSTDPSRFGADLWVGLLAAALVASGCIESLVLVLTGKWSNAFLFRLAAAGVVSVIVTFVVDLWKHNYWTFYGILLPLGESFFCWLVGAQIWRPSVRPAE